MEDCLIRTGRLFQRGTIRLKNESLKREVPKDFGRRFRLVADRVLPVAKDIKLLKENCRHHAWRLLLKKNKSRHSSFYEIWRRFKEMRRDL